MPRIIVALLVGLLWAGNSFATVQSSTWGAIKASVAGEESVAKLTISEPAAGTCERCGQARISIFENTAMVGGNEYTPTAVVGASHVKLASIVVQVHAKEAYRLRYLHVVSDLPPGVFDRVFYNLKAYLNGVQVGQTVGTLSDKIVAFQFGSTVGVEPVPAYTILDFYADISYDATAEDLAVINNRSTGPFGIWAVDGFSMVSGNFVMSHDSIKGQRVYLVPNGDLTITRSPASPAQQFARVGDEVVAGVYKVRTSVAEGIDLSELHVMVIVRDVDGRVIDPNAAVGEVRLYEDAVSSANLISSTWVVAAGDPGFSGRAPFIFPQHPLVIERMTSRDVILTFQVWPNAVPGTRIQFALYPRYNGYHPSIVAQGTTSGVVLWNDAVTLPEPILSSEVVIVE